MRYRRICASCRFEFLAKTPTMLYCSKKSCQPGYLQRRRQVKARVKQYPATLSTGTIGAAGEMAVCFDLMRKGYAVFRAISPSCYCDLIATKWETILEIEVRTGHQNNGKIIAGKSSHERVNCFALWNQETGDVQYFFPGSFAAMIL